MSRLRSERGFSLPELLTAMAIAMFVSLATFTLVEVVMKRSGDVRSRVETTASARTAMDQITRQLRSQVCVKPSATAVPRSLAAATPQSVAVYADFSNETLVNNKLPAPDLRKISLEDGELVETVKKGTRDNSNVVTYPEAVSSKRELLKPVAPLGAAGTPIFRYYRFPSAPANSTILPAGSTANVEVVGTGTGGALTEEQLTTVAMISVEFRAVALTGGDSAATEIKNQVYVRTADPNAQIPKPTCLTY